MKTININCDVGEGIGNEDQLMPLISSCNIACGGHFGDENSIDESIKLAIKNNVQIGVHPSFPDRENFGRKMMHISEKELQKSIRFQLDFFEKRLATFNQKLHHIKPHGALYNLISVDRKTAIIFINSIQKHQKNIFLYVPYNSEIEKVAFENNFKIKYEAFADRNYNENLTLLSRTSKNAIIFNEDEAVNHVKMMVNHQEVQTVSGVKKNIQSDTFCVHGDTKNAIKILKKLSKNFNIEKANNL